MSDPRPDELLQQSGRTAWRLGLKISWSDGLTGAAAKKSAGVGADAWKKPPPLNANEGAGVGYHATRARKRNPLVPAGDRLVIVEADLDVPDDAYPPLDEVMARVGALLNRLELVFPRTVVVRSRRGLHFIGCATAAPRRRSRSPRKATGSRSRADGYVVGVPGLHELRGVVYAVRPRRRDRGAADSDVRRQAGESRRRRMVGGPTCDSRAEPIPKGDRRDDDLLARARTCSGRPRARARSSRGLLEVGPERSAGRRRSTSARSSSRSTGRSKWGAAPEPRPTAHGRERARALAERRSRGGDGQAPPPQDEREAEATHGQSAAAPRASRRKRGRVADPEGTSVPLGTLIAGRRRRRARQDALALAWAAEVTREG